MHQHPCRRALERYPRQPRCACSRDQGSVAPDRAFGIGLRLSGEAAASARQPEELAAFRDQLAALGAYVFTINAFPFGPFHGVRVKEQVYLPDWRSAERVAFTADSAAVLAAILPDGGWQHFHGAGSIQAERRGARRAAAMAARMIEAVADLVETERRTGKRIALALEPEPCCFLETADESIAFFEPSCSAPEALDPLAARTGVNRSDAETAAAPPSRRLLRRLPWRGGIRGSRRGAGPAARRGNQPVPKIQLSAAMRIPVMTDGLIGAVMRYDDGVYLHQTIVRGAAGLARYVDLPDAVAAFKAGRADGEWRIHCHVPLFLADLGEIGSTRADLEAVLAALRRKSRSSHLEVETYTWDVLPDHCEPAPRLPTSHARFRSA